MLRLLASASGAPDRTPSASEGLFASPWHLLGRSLALPVLFGALNLCPCLVLAEDPPRPDPKNPVDYVKWCNEHYGAGIRSNTADLYIQSLQTHGCLDMDPGGFLYGDGRLGKWTEDNVKELRRWLEVNDEFMEDFAVAASPFGKCYFPLEEKHGTLCVAGGIPSPLVEELPNLPPDSPGLRRSYSSAMRDRAKMFTARAWLHLLDNDVEGAMKDLKTVFWTAQHLRAQPELLEYLVAVAMLDYTCRTLQHIPVALADEVDYTAILEELRRIDPIPRPPVRQIRHLLVGAFHNVQQFMTDEDGDGLYDHYAPLGPGTRLQLNTPLALDAVVDELIALRDRWLRIESMRDYAEARKLGLALAKELGEGQWGYNEDHSLDERAKKLLAQLTPGAHCLSRAWWMLIQFDRCDLARRNATRIVLNLHAFRAKHRRWPKNLKEGMADELPRFRRDPFSGEDFVYRLKDGQPLLYSFGVDGDDDGGRRARNLAPDADGDWVFWPPNKR
jgi:hypothetical protein